MKREKVYSKLVEGWEGEKKKRTTQKGSEGGATNDTEGRKYYRGKGALRQKNTDW